MKKFVGLFFFLVCTVSLSAQPREFHSSVSLSGFLAHQKKLPFWATSNRYGILPDSRGSLLEARLFSDFNSKHIFQLAYGISAAAYLSHDDNAILLDQLYISGKWKKLRLDLGMIHRETEYNGVSFTNGNIIYSNNARTMPGYNLHSDYIAVPWTHQVFSFQFNWADYLMIDDRYVHHTRLHNKSIFLKITPHARLEIILGLEHWVQWGGTSSRYGKQPSSFKDYLRIVCGKAGGDGATNSDIINALGNHLGREHLRINYKGDNYLLSFYHDIPFEDGSGTDFRSFPDGVYAFYFGSKEKKRWLSDIIYEFNYTKYQSGRYHNPPGHPVEVLGGNDNYFNNGEYQSGWTLYGRTIGSPLMTPHEPNAKGITLGIYNNRIIGHHIGLKGQAWKKIPYKIMLTYTLNYGQYVKPLPQAPQKQFSFALEAALPQTPKLPLRIDVGIYGDWGEFLPNNLGFTLKLSRKDIIKRKK